MQFYKSWSLLFLSFTSIQTDAFSTSLFTRNQNLLSENCRFSTSEHILFATKEQTAVEETTIFDTKKIIVECKDGNERTGENIQQESSKSESDNEEEEPSEEEVDEAEVERRRKAVIAAKLLKTPSSARSRSAAVSESQVKKALGRNTSVGVRREGSVSRARRGGLTGSILRGVKAGALSAKKKEKKDNDENGKGGTKAVKKTIIESTIDALIQSQRLSRDISSIGLLGNRETSASTSTPRTQKRYGPDRFGYEYGSQHLEISIVPEPGTVLVSKSLSKESSNLNASPIPMDSKMRIRQHTLVRTATIKDDLDIAKLRLSVFSDFTPEIRRQFRHRSMEVLGNRRLKGATCLVASVRYDYVDVNDISKSTEGKDWIIGSVECSTHEFVNTELGARRPGGSVLYITEVAVSPRVRRTGAGTKLLQGIDELAKIRNVETIYLHVDVTNEAACELYQKSGYEILDSTDPVYNDFTTKLNLHDGATKGRNHHLLHKKIQEQQTWIEPELKEEKNERRVLGFDVLD
ncbi:hypothetical protein CTEN210_02935 [Chaetoceros tenuissimus]|uniref:N-acetyltransferase domain-containing protein n=1 Tax=Chaetoceros tenuissimus TaxID=426638 RepID=A0AAD3CKC1_9STRA|nr:hypothetical protein CTEN210_02935 [Chaetoceros tenuissimus]